LTTVSRILITAGLDIQVTKNVDSGFLHCRHLDIQTSSDHLTGQQSCCPSPPTVNNSQKKFSSFKKVKVERVIIMLTTVFCILITDSLDVRVSNNVDRNLDI
jgi:hypothetical protein